MNEQEQTVNAEEEKEETTETTETKEKTGLFRQKNLDRISTPEQLRDYIHVTTPGIWIVLLAIIILLAGVLIWGAFGSIQVHNAAGEVVTISPMTLVTN